MVVPFVQGCSTSYFVKLPLKLVNVRVNGRWVLGEIPPAKWTMEFLRAKNYFSMNKTKLRSLRIWAQLTLLFSNLCPTSSQHQYSLRTNILARLTIGLALQGGLEDCHQYLRARPLQDTSRRETPIFGFRLLHPFFVLYCITNGGVCIHDRLLY